MDNCVVDRENAPDAEWLWEAEMFREYRASNSHAFILYFNVHDYVPAPSPQEPGVLRPRRLNRYLTETLERNGFDVVWTYSLSGGLNLTNETAMVPLIERIPTTVRDAGRRFGQPCGQNQPVNLSESQMALAYLHRVLTWRPDKKGRILLASRSFSNTWRPWHPAATSPTQARRTFSTFNFCTGCRLTLG